MMPSIFSIYRSVYMSVYGPSRTNFIVLKHALAIERMAVAEPPPDYPTVFGLYIPVDTFVYIVHRRNYFGINRRAFVRPSKAEAHWSGVGLERPRLLLSRALQPTPSSFFLRGKAAAFFAAKIAAFFAPDFAAILNFELTYRRHYANHSRPNQKIKTKDVPLPPGRVYGPPKMEIRFSFWRRLQSFTS